MQPNVNNQTRMRPQHPFSGFPAFGSSFASGFGFSDGFGSDSFGPSR